MLVLDVSENNGVIDWDSVVDTGVEGVIVRVGYGVSGTEDEMFRQNINAAIEHGLKVGAYWYSYALDVEGAHKEGEACARIISDWGGLLEFPVFFDMEDTDGYKRRHDFAFDAEEITAMCKAFIDACGLNCGVYASLDWFENYIDWQSLGCAVWNAQWGSDDNINGYAWQFTDSCEIGGKLFDASIFRV